jgi:membrane associated rhomboid family serine protease
MLGRFRNAKASFAMLFPIRTDRQLKRTPVVNYALIAANIVAFVFLQGLGRNTSPAFMLQPADPALFQYITYQFMHGGLMHIIGNMVALWVFGNGVEDRLGRWGYLLFYLAAGVLAGLGHAVTEISPVLGASGSVAGVTGAYLALFPLSRVVVLVFFFIITFVELPSIAVVGIYVAWNIFGQFTGGGGVAYTAHLAGYFFGFVVGMALLVSRLLPREPSDMMSLIDQKRRQQHFKNLARGGYSPWDSNAPGEPGQATAQAPTAEEQALMTQRSRVSEALRTGNPGHAAAEYRALLADYPDQVMSQQQQLDLANQLMSEGAYQEAAQAYELFLRHFPSYAHIQQVRLILGLIYARYLGQTDRARELLSEAEGKLSDDEQALARQVMAELG